MSHKSPDALMEQMRRLSRTKSTTKTTTASTTASTTTTATTQRSMVLLLHELKQRHSAELLYSSPVAEARHYSDRTAGVDPLAPYLALHSSEPLWDLQRQAVDFMARRLRDEDGQGCRGLLLCDDPGLGKTKAVLTSVLEENQASARHTGQRFNGATLIVCTELLVANWHSEMEKFPKQAFSWLDLCARDAHHTDRFYFENACDLVFCTYAAVAAAHKYTAVDADGGGEMEDEDREALRFRHSVLYGVKWRRVVADEAHQFVVARTLLARGMMELKAESKCVVTGTPFQNQRSDLWTLLHFIGVSESTADDALTPLLAALMLRRSKKDVQQQPSDDVARRLPLFTAVERRIQLVQFATVAEKMLYYAYAKYALQCRQTRHSANRTPQLINWLRQLCLSPRLVKDLVVPHAMLLLNRQLSRAGTGEAKELRHFMTQTLASRARYTYAEGETYRKSDAVYGDGVDQSSVVQFEWPPAEPVLEEPCDQAHYAMLETEWLAENAQLTWAMAEADVPADTTMAMLDVLNARTLDLARPSSKETALLELVAAVPRDEQIIVFCVSVTQLQHLQRLLREAGHTTGLVSGRNSQSENNSVMAAYKRTDSDMRILLMSLKLGNMGLNLFNASYVVFYDLWWNPAVLDQAEQRPQRHGQARVVHIIYLVMDHTIELYMMKLLEAKRHKLDSIVDQSTAGDEALNEEEQKALFDYRVTVEM